jgi:ABC-type nitrate/sulfonate/bicarbonate transport system permease component
MAWVRGLAIPVLLVTFWELAAQFELITTSLSRPSLVVQAIQSALLDGSLLVATLQTLQTTLLGLLVATATGIAIGLLLGLFPLMNGIVGPSLEALRPIPAVALIPLALLIFGFGISLEVSIIVFACIWPIVVVTIAAVQGVDERLVQVARGLEFSLYDRIVKFILPAVIGRIWVGIRIAAGVALIVAVTVEIVINPRGLGYAMIFAQQMFQVDLVYGYLVWTGIVGWFLNWIIQFVDRNWLARYTLDGR